MTGAQPASRRLLWPALFTVFGVIVLIALGMWQLERRAWKNTLLERVDARIHGTATPVPPPSEWPAWQARDDEYRRVTAQGHYLFDKQVLVRGNSPRERGNVFAGFVVLTPLALADGAIILVNRGFIAQEQRQALAELDGHAEPAVTVTGLMRASQDRGAFVPADDPARGEWFTRDIAAIANAKGLSRVAPFILDAEAAPERTQGPRGGLTVVSFPNNHLEYAMTWFSLAATLVAVFIVYATRRSTAASTER